MDFKKVLDYDPLTGITEIFHHDSLTNETVIETVQDVEPALEQNKRLQIETDPKKQIKEGWLHYAHIPDSILLKWSVEKGIPLAELMQNSALLFGLVNDSDYAHLKTTSAKHQA
jgi:hypothetical protein